MSGVNSCYFHPRFLGFVIKKVPELGEGPAMQPATILIFLLEFGAVAKLGQILSHDGFARGGTLDNPFGENVRPEDTRIPLKPCQSSFQLSQMPFGRFCAFGLQTTFKVEVTMVK